MPDEIGRVLWFVQLRLLVFGQALLDDFQLLKSIFEHGLFHVFLSDTDRREQDGFCGQGRSTAQAGRAARGLLNEKAKIQRICSGCSRA